MNQVPVFASFLSALLLLGCNSAVETMPPKETAAPGDGHDHSHDHANHQGQDHERGPHGGAIADWGGGVYHAEFKVDRDSKKTTVYILGSDEKTPVAIKTGDGTILLSIKQPLFQVILEAKPQKGDEKGKSSRFEGRHENLGGAQEFSGTLSGEVDGTPYAGEFAE